MKMGHFNPVRPDYTKYIKCGLICSMADSLAQKQSYVSEAEQNDFEDIESN
jgi:hypothetical protein